MKSVPGIQWQIGVVSHETLLWGPEALTRSMTSSSLRRSRISSRLLTRPISPEPTSGATVSMALLIMWCSSSLECRASLPP